MVLLLGDAIDPRDVHIQSERKSLQCVVSCTQPRIFISLFYLDFFLYIWEVTEANPSVYVYYYTILDESRMKTLKKQIDERSIQGVGGDRTPEAAPFSPILHYRRYIIFTYTFAVRHLLASFSCNHLWQFGLVALGNALCALLASCIIIYMVKGRRLYNSFGNIRRIFLILVIDVGKTLNVHAFFFQNIHRLIFPIVCMMYLRYQILQ